MSPKTVSMFLSTTPLNLNVYDFSTELVLEQRETDASAIPLRLPEGLLPDAYMAQPRQ
jgi:hypothetical protein